MYSTTVVWHIYHDATSQYAQGTPALYWYNQTLNEIFNDLRRNEGQQITHQIFLNLLNVCCLAINYHLVMKMKKKS